MAVVSVNERVEERRSEQDYRGRRHTRAYIVVCDNKTDGTNVALMASAGGNSIPNVGDGYTDVDEFSWATRKYAIPHESQPHTFKVTCEYTSSPEHTFSPYDDDPLRHSPSLRIYGVTTNEEFQVDMDGKDVHNSARVPFDPPLTRDFTRWVIVFSRNQDRFNSYFLDRYRDALNNDVFLGLQPGHVKIGGLEGDLQYSGNIGYYRVTYTLHFNMTEEAFEPAIADIGFQERITITNAQGQTESHLVEMVSPVYGYKVDEQGDYIIPLELDPEPKSWATISSPQYLDGQGRRLKPPQPGEPEPQIPKLNFRRHPTAPFARLAIEAPILHLLARPDILIGPYG